MCKEYIANLHYKQERNSKNNELNNIGTKRCSNNKHLVAKTNTMMKLMNHNFINNIIINEVDDKWITG